MCQGSRRPRKLRSRGWPRCPTGVAGITISPEVMLAFLTGSMIATSGLSYALFRIGKWMLERAHEVVRSPRSLLSSRAERAYGISLWIGGFVCIAAAIVVPFLALWIGWHILPSINGAEEVALLGGKRLK